MMQNEEKVKRIIQWRESLSLLPDERFFDIMRTYLGAIQTPFNKTNLIERLSSIFRKEQNQQIILSYLSDFDIKMLSAISAVSKATQNKLTDFFSSDYSISEIISELLNLNERLLIYIYTPEDSKTNLIAINPLLEDLLEPLLSTQRLFPQAICVSPEINSPFSLKPLFLASFLAYVQSYPEMCKNDVSIKKKDMERLEQIFSERADCISLLLTGFINLGIIKPGEKELSIDQSHLEKFADLSERNQYAFLSTASAVHLGRDGLRTQTQLLLDIAETIPSQGFTRSELSKAAFLLNNQDKKAIANQAQSRFSRMLESHKIETSENSTEYSGQIIDKIIDSAIKFGLFCLIGKNEKDEPIYIKGEVFQNQENSENIPKRGLLNINAGTSITIMPGFQLADLLPVTSFMDIISCDTVTEFEITRKSISRAFDKNITTEQIFTLLADYSNFEIPQSLKMNIEEWFSSYTSAILYKGYVLKVDEKSARVIEKNPKIAPYIQLQLGPGIYLLNVQKDQDAEQFISSCGLDFMGNIKAPKKETDAVDYPILRKGQNLLPSKENPYDEKEEIQLSQKASEMKKNLHIILEKMDISKQAQECLSNRIDRNLIISEEQLSSDNVRLEILEVDGMNYAGKVRLVENAISSHESIELEMPSETDPLKKVVYVGTPLMLSKHTNDALVRIALQPDYEIRFFSISKASRIKLLKTSIFS